MKTVIIFTVLLLVLIIVIVLAISTVIKLTDLKNTLDNDWNKLIELYNKKVELASRIIEENEGDTQILINIIKRYENSKLVDDIIDSYIELARIMPTYGMSEELNNAYQYNKEQFDKTRDDYNNNVLKFNCIIKSFPRNILARFTGFTKWTYFRKED